MEKQKVCVCTSVIDDLHHVLSELTHDRLFVLTDAATSRHCLPLIQGVPGMEAATEIVIPAGDLHKNVESLSLVWKHLSEFGATRKSLMINLGGGMVTDLGGFAASTFKRGIRFVNIPTTLLAIVDASVGGKTGVNFNGLKNEVGVFNTAAYVLIDSLFLKTLDRENLLSGYAEMLKHGLIDTGTAWSRLLSFDWDEMDYALLQGLAADSVKVKERIVAEDPLEKGIRKALNLGHTVGHAFESLSFEQGRPLSHGYAVAFGLICELYLSCTKCGFPKSELQKAIAYIKEYYGRFMISCNHYEQLFQLMQHDKKNEDGQINFTLLSDVGKVLINQRVDKEELFEMFDFYTFSLGG